VLGCTNTVYSCISGDVVEARSGAFSGLDVVKLFKAEHVIIPLRENGVDHRPDHVVEVAAGEASTVVVPEGKCDIIDRATYEKPSVNDVKERQ